MRARPVRLLRRAESHVTKAFDWYESKRPGLGADFLAAFERFLRRIAGNPGVCPVYRDNVRRLFMKSFSYLIFYKVTDAESIVVLVIHANRDPRYWP